MGRSPYILEMVVYVRLSFNIVGPVSLKVIILIWMLNQSWSMFDRRIQTTLNVVGVCTKSREAYCPSNLKESQR